MSSYLQDSAWDEGLKVLEVPKCDLSEFHVGDRIAVSGIVYAGRDAVLPLICQSLVAGRDAGISLEGAAFFHTAVSAAGIGPTSSNKAEIEESFVPLMEAGAKVFFGKGALDSATVKSLGSHGAIFAVVPPVTALLEKSIRSKRCIAHQELGMEALYELKLDRFPAIVAAAEGTSMFGGI